MHPSCAAENDAARNVDEIGGGDAITENVKEFGHGFARKDVARKKDAGKNREESELHGLRLGIGFAGDQDAERERHEDVRKGKQGEQQNAAVNGHAENKAHEGENHAEFEEADHQVGKQLAEQQAHGAHRGDEKLFERAAFFFANDGKCGEECGDVEQKNGGEPGKEKIGRAGIG